MSTRRKKNRAGAVHKLSGDSPPLDTRSPLRRASEAGESLYLGQGLVDRCGSIDSVEALTSEVLPPDPFDWGIVQAEDRAVVEAMLGLLESVCEDHLDSEYYTIMNRLIEVAVTHPDQPLRTRTSHDRLAAGLLWIALVANMDQLVMSSPDASRNASSAAITAAGILWNMPRWTVNFRNSAAPPKRISRYKMAPDKTIISVEK